MENISAGGVKFLVTSQSDLKDKILHLRIKVPELTPYVLDLQALVLESKPRINPKFQDVRAKFVNIKAADKQQLDILEGLINQKKA